MISVIGRRPVAHHQMDWVQRLCHCCRSSDVTSDCDVQLSAVQLFPLEITYAGAGEVLRCAVLKLLLPAG